MLGNREVNDLLVRCWFHKAAFEPGHILLDDVVVRLNEKPLPALRAKPPNNLLTIQCPIGVPLKAPQQLSFDGGETVTWNTQNRSGRVGFCA